MRRWMRWSLFTSIGAALLLATAALAQRESMTFFVTSVGTGKGADLGGLAGADRHCQTLAAAVGAGNRTWRAYLSASATGTTPAVNARDRIGRGPWRNANGVVIARDIEQLHTANSIGKQTALTEKGDMVNGRGDAPNKHDILTGSQADGRAFSGERDTTCGNWTKSGEGARWSVITTASGSATTTRRSRGTHRMRRAAAARTRCAGPAATACSIASPSTERGQ